MWGGVVTPCAVDHLRVSAIACVRLFVVVLLGAGRGDPLSSSCGCDCVRLCVCGCVVWAWIDDVTHREHTLCTREHTLYCTGMYHSFSIHSFICLSFHFRPRIEQSHSCWPRTVWCVVNMFHKNGMRPLIIASSTNFYSIWYCNSPRLYIRLKYTYSVISVKLDWLPGNSKKWTID